MIEPTTAPASRINCEAIGKPKLLAEITPDAISVWCRICKRAHLIQRETVMRAWEKGESVQCVEEER